jgi:hypothetical protein
MPVNAGVLTRAGAGEGTDLPPTWRLCGTSERSRPKKCDIAVIILDFLAAFAFLRVMILTLRL